MRIVAAVFLGFALSSSATAGQQDSSRPASRVIERTDASGGAMPWRLRQTTNQAGDRETTTEIEEMPNTDGRMVPVRETVIEVVRAGTMVRTTAKTSGVGVSGQWIPLETRESIEEQPSAERVRTASTIWRPDVNGRLAMSERIADETSMTPEGRRTERTILRPDLNGRLRPMERTEHTERYIAPQAVRSTTTDLQVDVNGRWQVIEIRNRDARTIGVTEDVEETIQLRDLNGALWDRPTMRGRIRRTTTPREDGGRRIVEEVEERNPVALSDPLRIVRRVVETTRRTDAGGWATERQVFERDPNNRLVLTMSETEETKGPANR